MSESRLVSRSRERVSAASRQRVVTLLCPFCDTHTEAHLWSVAGSGKRCECGAVFRRNNATGDYVSVRR